MDHWSPTARRCPDCAARCSRRLEFIGNWWLIVQNVSYFDRFAPPTPLGHLWSLAVEEQFYLVWPWVLLGALWLARRRRQRWAGVPRACRCGIRADRGLCRVDGTALPARLR